MESLKRIFKGMFRRNKKPKQDQEKPTVNTSTRQHYTTSAADTAPPQLPPIQNNSPLQSATETSKPLPATHPLSTGTHNKPQEAVPQNHKVQPRLPAPGPKIPSRPEGAEKVKEEEKKPENVPQPEPYPVNDATKKEASPVENDSMPPPPPPKNDSAVEQVKPEPAAAAAVLPAAEPAKEPAKENIPPNTTATEDKPTTNGTSATDEKSSESSPNDDDGKMLAIEEPPPIKAVRAAPGMSATSGPLEDFPEGGGMIEE